MSVLAPLRERVFLPEVFFRFECVVRRTVQRKVFGCCGSTTGEGVVMMKLESCGLATALATRVDVGAAVAVAFEDGAPHFGRHVSPALAR